MGWNDPKLPHLPAWQLMLPVSWDLTWRLWLELYMCPFHVAVWTSSHHGSRVPREREREQGYRQKPCLLCDLALETMQYHFHLILFIKGNHKVLPHFKVGGGGKQTPFLDGMRQASPGKAWETGNITVAIFEKYVPYS